MRKIINYTIGKESFESMQAAFRYNPALEICFTDKSGRHTHTLAAGYRDDLYVYREASETYVLSLNSELSYVGLQAFKGADFLGEIFMQDYQIEETSGICLNLAPYTIIRRLLEYLS